jgi:glucose-6-phosphate 1-dehydrogenase
VALDANAVRDEKVKVLRAIEPFSPALVARDVVRGQYGPGWIAGLQVNGYRAEPGVAPDSLTETYVALKLHVDNWRWAGTPFLSEPASVSLSARRRLPLPSSGRPWRSFSTWMRTV